MYTFNFKKYSNSVSSPIHDLEPFDGKPVSFTHGNTVGRIVGLRGLRSICHMDWCDKSK